MELCIIILPLEVVGSSERLCLFASDKRIIRESVASRDHGIDFDSFSWIPAHHGEDVGARGVAAWTSLLSRRHIETG
jgi:hypothetical protein